MAVNRSRGFPCRCNYTERLIYQSCEVKWRDHGYLSVDNCSVAQARHYQRYGEFRD